MALQFSISNRGGLWTPAGETTRDYLDLALERIRRRVRSRCRRERRELERLRTDLASGS